MTPHLVKWHDQYAASGLRVVEISNGQMDELSELREHLLAEGIQFPVLHDTNGEICARFGVSAFPTAFLIGRDGNVIWGGHPADAARHEQMIEQALRM